MLRVIQTWVRLLGPILLCERKQDADSPSKRHLACIRRRVRLGLVWAPGVSQRSGAANSPGASPRKDLPEGKQVLALCGTAAAFPELPHDNF